MILSFFLVLLMFLAVGAASVIQNRHTTIDYLVATHSVNPFIVALSAVATNNSGYMFIGMIGFTYVYGLISIWLMIGLILGDFVISFLVHSHLREVSAKSDVYSYSGILSDWYGHPFRLLRKISGIITLIFLLTYAAAQLKAGSKTLHVLFGFHESIGALLGGGIVLVYCFVGGIRASFWSDIAQALVMLLAMAVLVYSGVAAAGGMEQVYQSLESVSPTYLSVFPTHLPFGMFWGPFLFIVGWFVAGVAVVGQPHIMVRFMALDSISHLTKTRCYYYTWFILFYLLTLGAGLLSRILIDPTEGFDPEIAFPVITVKLLPGFLAGAVIAGIFAATMSTADSQIMACTASLTGDFTKKHITNYYLAKGATVLVTLFTIAIAIWADDTVFNLVILSWGALGSAFTPLLVLYSKGKKLTEQLSIIIVLTGLSTAILYKIFFGWTGIYEVFPGVVAGFIPYFYVRFRNHKYELEE